MRPNEASIHSSSLCRRAACCALHLQNVSVRQGSFRAFPGLLMALPPRPPFIAAQSLDPAALLKPATDTWPTYNGDYSGRRYSTLNQINVGNIRSLTLAWAFNT